jgi:energy-converting hydrogenase Eha subunit H
VTHRSHYLKKIDELGLLKITMNLKFGLILCLIASLNLFTVQALSLEEVSDVELIKLIRQEHYVVVMFGKFLKNTNL